MSQLLWKLFFFISNFFLIPFFSQFGSQSHPYFLNYPPMLILDPPHTPRPWRSGEDLAIQRVIRLLQAASSRPSAVTPGAQGAFCMRASKLLSPPPSLEVTSQLCHSSMSRPNSALGRGGIWNPEAFFSPQTFANISEQSEKVVNKNGVWTEGNVSQVGISIENAGKSDLFFQ